MSRWLLYFHLVEKESSYIEKRDQEEQTSGALVYCHHKKIRRWWFFFLLDVYSSWFFDKLYSWILNEYSGNDIISSLWWNIVCWMNRNFRPKKHLTQLIFEIKSRHKRRCDLINIFPHIHRLVIKWFEGVWTFLYNQNIYPVTNDISMMMMMRNEHEFEKVFSLF